MAHEATTAPRTKRRLARPAFLAIAAIAVVGLCTNAGFARQPELVWWMSAPLGDARLRARLLVPAGWTILKEETSSTGFTFVSPQHQPPSWLTWLVPPSKEHGEVEGHVEPMFLDSKEHPPDKISKGVITHGGGGYWASIYRLSQDRQYMLTVTVQHSSEEELDRIGRRICDSFQIR